MSDEGLAEERTGTGRKGGVYMNRSDGDGEGIGMGR